MLIVSLLILTLGASTASARPVTPPALVSTHNARDTTWRWQRAGGFCCRPYHWYADRRSTPAVARWRVAGAWWRYARLAHARYVRERALGVPSWFHSAAECIAVHESGYQNSWAGYYGMIYSPSSYPGSSGIVAAYGDSWLAIPKSAQERIVYALYQRYGWSPWSTAPGCGLG